jgi:hypothetical protein
VISEVINNDHVFDLSVLTHFPEDFLEEGLESGIDKCLTCWVPSRHLPLWRCYRKWWQFRWHCFHTYARAGQSSWWEACYEFSRNYPHSGRRRSYRRRGSWPYPSTFRTLWIIFRPSKLKSIIRVDLLSSFTVLNRSRK